jgi:hypothetical protein
MVGAIMNAAKPRTKRKMGGRREPFVITASIVVLGVVVLLCAALLAPPLWTVLVEAWHFSPRTQECSTLKDAIARRACFDEFDARTTRHPAKGTNAPPIP